MPRVFLIGTLDTKTAEMAYLAEALSRQGLEVEVVDISLGAQGRILAASEKLARMADVAAAAAETISSQRDSSVAAVGVGGGTGAEIALNAMKALPAYYPKVLITTLAFDPRAALADTAITLVPTLCDIEGLNPALRQVFENSAAMVAGLAQAASVAKDGRPNIAVTTLGATGPAGCAVAKALNDRSFDTTLFHANGYGGAAFSRFVSEGGAAGVIDLNVHELGRIRIAGAHVPMPERFSCANGLPRIVLPGALNFIGLGALSTLTDADRARPHYQHSGNFTHVALTEDQMAAQAQALAEELNRATAPCHVLIPMGGFSHEDRPGGAIEAPALREIAATVMEAQARRFTLARLPFHINTDNTARAAVDALLERMPDV